MNPKKIVAVGLIGVGAVDLLFGSTTSPILPDFLANNLTQQIDLVLIGLGALLLFYF